MKIPYNFDLTPEQNRQNAIAAVTENGANLQFVDQRYRDNQDIALIAVRQDPYAFRHHVIALFKNYLKSELRGSITEEDFKAITKNATTISQNQHFQTFLQGLGGANKTNLLAVQIAAIEARKIDANQACIVKKQGAYMVDFKEMESQSYCSQVAKIAFNKDLRNRRSEIFSEATKKLVLESYLYDRRFGGALLQLCVDGVVNYKHYNESIGSRTPLDSGNFSNCKLGELDPTNTDNLIVELNNNGAALIYKFIPKDEQGKTGCVKPFYSNNGIEIEITRDQSRAFLPKIVDNESGHIFNQEIINEILTPQQLNALAQPIVNDPVIEIVNNPEQQIPVNEPQIRKQVKIEIDESQNQIENPSTEVGSPKVYQMIDKSQNQRDL